MKGGAIIAAFILIVIGTLIVGGYLLYISRQSFMTRDLNNSIKALYIAEAGLERKLYELQQENYSDIGETKFPDDDPNNDPNITYEVDVEDEGPMYTVTSTGRYYGKERVVEINAEVIGIWDSAVFLGGVASGQIHGNTQIRGTVYVLGEESFVDANENNLYDDGEFYTEVDGYPGRSHLLVDDVHSDNALEAAGTFYIGNQYATFPGNPGMETTTSIQSRIDTDWDLYAELNVKYGQVELQSASAWVGNGEEMELVNVVDRFDPEDAPLEGPGQRVYTERLLESRSRFPDELRFPSLSDMVGGATRINTLLSQSQSSGTYITGPLTITPTSTDFNYNNLFTKTGNTITIADNTIVYIAGALTLDSVPGPGGDTIEYIGNGSIVVTGSLTINTNLITDATNPPGSYAYPDNNIIGFMTPNDIYIAAPGSANLELMAVFYAEGTINFNKHTRIAGSLVSNNLTMGNNNPAVFQVNNLSDNLPLGMIDIPPVVIIDSWHEVFGEEE